MGIVSKSLAVISSAFSLVLICLCAHAAEPGEPSRQTTSEPKQVDASRDPLNVSVKDNLVVVLAIRIRIDASGPQLVRAGMVMGPSREGHRREGDLVVVTALADGSTVSQTAVADPRLVAVEGVGLVEAQERDVEVLLPLPRRIDTIKVTATADGATREFDVTEMMTQLCTGKYESVPACR